MKKKKYYVRTLTDKRTGKRLYFYGKTAREANLKMIEHQTARRDGRMFPDLANAWWSDEVENLAPQTVKGYKAPFGRVVDYFQARRARDIAPQDIRDFFTELKRQGYAKKSVANHRIIINQILDYAVVNGDIDLNPCSAVKIPNGLAQKKRTAATEDEEKIITERADLWVFPFFALKTGLRRGELLALQWQDIDFEKNLIHVTKSASYEKNDATIKEPKTEAGVRAVPLLSSLRERILPLRGKPEEYVFGGKRPPTLKKFFHDYYIYKKQSGIKASPHQLRHSFATVAFEAGLSAKEAQELLGHRQIQTTLDIYTDFREQSLHRSAALLEEKEKSGR